MVNNFIKDRTYGEKWEDFICDLVNEHFKDVTEKYDNCKFRTNHVRKDDDGIDVYSPGIQTIIDVKAYRPPMVLRHYDGIYLETLHKRSRKDGWYVDDSKKNNWYAFVQDGTNGMEFYKIYLISKKNLQRAAGEAMLNEECEIKESDTTLGRELPYKYLDKHSSKIWYGTRYYEEQAEG